MKRMTLGTWVLVALIAVFTLPALSDAGQPRRRDSGTVPEIEALRSPSPPEVPATTDQDAIDAAVADAVAETLAGAQGGDEAEVPVDDAEGDDAAQLPADTEGEGDDTPPADESNSGLSPWNLLWLLIPLGWFLLWLRTRHTPTTPVVPRREDDDPPAPPADTEGEVEVAPDAELEGTARPTTDAAEKPAEPPATPPPADQPDPPAADDTGFPPADATSHPPGARRVSRSGNATVILLAMGLGAMMAATANAQNLVIDPNVLVTGEPIPTTFTLTGSTCAPQSPTSVVVQPGVTVSGLTTTPDGFTFEAVATPATERSVSNVTVTCNDRSTLDLHPDSYLMMGTAALSQVRYETNARLDSLEATLAALPSPGSSPPPSATPPAPTVDADAIESAVMANVETRFETLQQSVDALEHNLANSMTTVRGDLTTLRRAIRLNTRGRTDQAAELDRLNIRLSGLESDNSGLDDWVRNQVGNRNRAIQLNRLGVEQALGGVANETADTLVEASETHRLAKWLWLKRSKPDQKRIDNAMAVATSISEMRGWLEAEPFPATPQQ